MKPRPTMRPETFERVAAAIEQLGGRPVHERELIGTLLARRVEGILLVPAPGDHSFLHRTMATGVPLVFIDRPPDGVAADTVLFDDRDGARRGVGHLIERGQRVDGYRDALAGAGLPVDDALLARLAGYSSPPQQIVLPTRLVTRAQEVAS